MEVDQAEVASSQTGKTTHSARSGDSELPGLSAADAALRLQSEGYNELPQTQRRTPLRIILDVIREPMLALLIGGGLVYLALGSAQEALVLLAFACFSVVITVVQEARTERVLEALRDLTSPRALVIRDGARLRIAGREVVRGDLVVLAEGDRVPADARVLTVQDLQADESLLTGESVPVRKKAGSDGEDPPPRPGGDDLSFVFSGALIVRGAGIAEVVATGANSEIGKIGKSLSLLEVEAPQLQRQTRKVVLFFALAGALVSTVVVLLYGLFRGGWLEALLAGIAVGMSMLPEEFPVVLAVFMAMGAWRISQLRVLTRRASAIETLGAATVLCTDKTGTLTENRMTVAELRLSDESPLKINATDTQLPETFQEMASLGVLASAPEPFDPMEKAFRTLAESALSGPPGVGQTLLKTYALRPDLLAMSQVWKGTGNDQLVAAKGAPEAIAKLCKLDDAARAAVTQAVDEMAQTGLRVLGVAQASFAGTDLPNTQQDFDFRFVGLVGLADPVRESVPSAIAECRNAGIRVIMITGDYPATAFAVAVAAGLSGEDMMSGDELESLNDDELASRLRTVNIFARIMPEQKLRIVNALKANGEIVAMTGDGVNDAPSLKAAHIGVAMGGRGTDVAREASSIVLLDDDFGSIVDTIRLGRRIYTNLRKAMSFILAVHIPIAGLALMPLIFGLPILFGPMHIAFLEMVIDPVCSLVFEAETAEEGQMRRPPRAANEPLFSALTIAWSLLQGALVFALLAAIFVVLLHYGLADDQVRAVTFASLVVSIIALILVNRSAGASIITAIRRPNRALGIVFPIVATLLAMTLFWPYVRSMFGFAALDVSALLIPLATGVVVLVTLEGLKPLWHRVFPEPSVSHSRISAASSAS
ncbi:MAG: cation-translocating P-type ATPase [Xanthomonadales bacterium]|nr:cation-translocating P-type ATPase [Xanthomonadales bacterium]